MLFSFGRAIMSKKNLVVVGGMVGEGEVQCRLVIGLVQPHTHTHTLPAHACHIPLARCSK
eukprot:m.65423 g.65423  ORF g.65423 m.65423 type:complete len:60 (+) comp12056_c0_seq1:197-376(+)